MRFNDRALGLVGVALAVAYGWGATRFPEPFGGAEIVGPETFPIILSVILTVTSLYLVFRPDPDHRWPARRTAADMGIAIVTLILYTALIEPLGFIIATTLAIGTLSWRMGARAKLSYLIALVSGSVIFLLFNQVLELSLPLGVLEIGSRY
ncbi:tricarboxylic transporter [Marinobacterium aestuarii]|uniref:Tricarboxylic transporter n=1 Tax=Marinobacterium aestuarii TaxID=1821621 RepID=A0A1A9F3Z7_9GAMM|nr:tripartite tricarboxylate transporter TctB family protein [Marinobacterium aestuarii]ANG64453.1 tricarboxylic transporter [Marinobacterium aestuarii]